MLDDLAMRKLNHRTQQCYIRAVVKLTRYLKRSPDTATADELRDFQLHMVNEGISPGTLNATITGLRFFFETTLDCPALVRKMRHVHEPRRLPEILSVEEVTKILQSAGSLKYQAALSVGYGAGLRASEITHLKVTDVDSERMILRVEQGKGGRDRHAMLSPELLTILRTWYRAGQAEVKMLPGGWLFPGQQPVNPLSTRQLRRTFHRARDAAGVTKKVSLHALRHAFATHLLEQHEDIRVIQVLLGHRKLESTARYSHVAANRLREVKGPLTYLKL
ncbi:MAG: integrase/recombinase XerD [Arenicella sp.]|jgi:integrase/recombinase XerD